MIACRDFPISEERRKTCNAACHQRFDRRKTGQTDFLLQCPTDIFADDIVDARSGDILLCLDLSGSLMVQAHKAGLYRDMKNNGVHLFAMVHDILPIQMPHFFPEGADIVHREWLEAVISMDGCICVSKAVADAVRFWCAQHLPSQTASFRIEWSHHGADIESSAPSAGLPADAEGTLSIISECVTFLMVGTIEPRKGHSQTLQAFEELWQQGESVNLCIVGKEGWMVEDLLQKLRSHPENGRRLFLLRGISDEFLENVYAACTCLIFASEGEGFGLPLIEAAKHRLPIIARDIPVFREVAGEHAFYFSGKTGSCLAEAVREWMGLYHEGRHPKSDAMPWLTWKQSAERLKEIILRGAENNMEQMHISEQILEK